MDDHLVGSAKEYSAKTGRSVSRIVADLFEVIKNEQSPNESSLPPTVSALKGVLSGATIGDDDYRKHLEEKYL